MVAQSNIDLVNQQLIDVMHHLELIHLDGVTSHDSLEFAPKYAILFEETGKMEGMMVR
jgi:hypothetical protein